MQNYILGLSMWELLCFVVVMGFATGRVTRLLMNEAGFLYTGTIFRHLFGQRYYRAVPKDRLEESGMTEEEYPEKPNLWQVIKFAKDNNLGAYQLKVENYLGMIVTCPFCLGYWIAVFGVFSLLMLQPLANNQLFTLTFEDLWWGAWVASAVAQVGVMAYRKT